MAFCLVGGVVAGGAVGEAVGLPEVVAVGELLRCTATGRRLATSTLVGWRRQAAARVESKSRVKKAN